MDTSKIIKGVVNSGRYTVTAPIVKEDYGLYLQIEGVELPSTYEVDFSNSEHNGTSVTMIGNADGVLIPHQFIDTGKDIFAFLYHVGANYGRTVYKFRIPNKVRPDRTNEQPTPEEQSVIDQAISALNEAVAQTAQDVISADQSAQSAQGYAEQAETARDTAQTYANNAQTSANNASQSASQASASATSAQNALDMMASAIVETVSGRIVRFDDGADNVLVESVKINTSASSATLIRAGRNIFSGWADSNRESKGITFTYLDNDRITIVGTSTETNADGANKVIGGDNPNPIPFEAGKTYTVSLNGTVGTNVIRLFLRDNNNTVLWYGDSTNGIWTVTPESAFVAERISFRTPTSRSVMNVDARLMIEVSDTVTDYEAFGGNVYSVSLVGGVVQEDIPTHKGINTIWSVDGSIEVKYRADTVLYMDGMVDDAQSYAESALIASQASVTARNTAQGYAQSASASAQSASTSASNASTSAQTASTKASEASGYASTASNKASEASQSASQALSYKTDAEQAKTASQTAQGLAESARDSAISAKTDAESAKDDAVQAKEDAESAVASISGALADKADVITDTASGAIASFTDGADDLPLKSLIVDINPVQDTSSGDPSPENICPISGWTQVGVNQFAVNVWDEEWELGDISASTGQNAVSNTVIRTKNYIPVRPNTTYFAYVNFNNSGYVRSRFYDVNKNYIGSTPKDRTSVSYNQPFTTPDNCYYMRFTPQATYGTTYNHDISINYPSTDHYYHPYTGRSITINLGQTVYGGKLDVLSGKLTVYPYYASYNGETLTGRWISDRDVYASGTTPTIGAQVVNIGAQGTEYQLTPHEVNSLLGQNNIFADTGDTACEYRADTKLYIERLTAPDSADMIADSNIVSGQYFMVGNTLYKATANIANGGQITVGTNCTRVSLAQALNEINA